MSKKANARRERNSQLANDLSKQLKRSLRADRRRRIFDASIEIERDLRTGDIVGAYDKLRAWYKKFSGRSEKPTRVDMEKHTSTYRHLFTAGNMNSSLPFPIVYNGPEVPDGPPDEDEIHEALMKMKNGKSPGLTKITVENMKHLVQFITS